MLKSNKKTAPKKALNQLQKAHAQPATVAAHDTATAPSKKAPAKKPAIIAANKPTSTPADKAEQRQALTKLITAERASAAKLFDALTSGTISIPIKPLSAYKRSYKRDVPPHAIGRNPKPRSSAAVAAPCLAAGKALKNGAKFPRNFTHAGVSYTVENGALADAQRAGLCSYDSATESITITNAAEIASQIGQPKALAV